jgi:hypothetical protein
MPKKKKGEIENKQALTVIQHSAITTLKPSAKMALDHIKDSPKSMPLRRKQSNIVVARSKIFTLDKVQVYKTMPSIRSLPNTTNEH